MTTCRTIEDEETVTTMDHRVNPFEELNGLPPENMALEEVSQRNVTSSLCSTSLSTCIWRKQLAAGVFSLKLPYHWPSSPHLKLFFIGTAGYIPDKSLSSCHRANTGHTPRTFLLLGNSANHCITVLSVTSSVYYVVQWKMDPVCHSMS